MAIYKITVFFHSNFEGLEHVVSDFRARLVDGRGVDIFKIKQIPHEEWEPYR